MKIFRPLFNSEAQHKFLAEFKQIMHGYCTHDHISHYEHSFDWITLKFTANFDILNLQVKTTSSFID